MEPTRLFKKGDRVICIDNTETKGYPWEGLQIGDIGTVMEDCNKSPAAGLFVQRDRRNETIGWFPQRWRLLSEAQVPQELVEPTRTLSRIELILQEKANAK